jgi:hypothetical protein
MTEKMKLAALDSYYRRCLRTAPDSEVSALTHRIQILNAVRLRPQGARIFEVLANSPHREAGRILREFAK